MERTLRSMFIATVAVLALLGCSAAQTTHDVGGSLGWVFVPGVQAAYTSWAGNQSFRVGDTLVFTFANGAHNVAEVSRADFDACNTNNPIFTNTNSPARVALNATGTHYYICTFPGHCNGGQKLQINVSAAASSSPAPQPASPAPRANSSPAPQPATPAPRASPPTTPPPAAATPSSVPTSSPSPATTNSNATPPSPSTSVPTTPSPGGGSPGSSSPSPDGSSPGSSATSLGVAGVSATLFSLVVALFLVL